MNRKSFLQNLGYLTSGALLPPLQQKKSPISGQVQITGIECYVFRKACFVEVQTDAGISGWGESDGASRKITPVYIKDFLQEYYIGKDPFDSEGLWHEAYLKGLESGIAGIHPGSLAGIDNALWDLKGKLLNLPVYKLLGGNGKKKIQVYASYGRDKGNYHYMTPLEMANVAEGFLKDGYKAIKARMQIRQENLNPYPDDIYDCVAAIRKAIGDDIKLFIDFNNGYTPGEANRMIRKLFEDFNIDIVEEPVFQQDYEGLSDVVRDSPIPVMAGEHEYSKWMFKDLITIAKVDILNADVIKCGGITECRKVAAIAHAFGNEIMVHNAKPTLATAASLQLLASIPNGARFQEYAGKRLQENYGPLYDLFENYFHFQDGYLHLTEEPGLGLVVKKDQMLANRLNR